MMNIELEANYNIKYYTTDFFTSHHLAVERM